MQKKLAYKTLHNERQHSRAHEQLLQAERLERCYAPAGDVNAHIESLTFPRLPSAAIDFFFHTKCAFCKSNSSAGSHASL
jgi:hypothetical protein